MKGASGLLIAVALGVIGAFCNWVYLAQKGKELDLVDFIGCSRFRYCSRISAAAAMAPGLFSDFLFHRSAC